MIKVCGMREADNIRAVETLGIQWMGFIFWPGSSRFVSEEPAYLPTNCLRVGVFVDASNEDIVSKVAAYRLGAVQLHGHESPELIARLREAIDSNTLVIKALSISSIEDIQLYRQYEGLVDYFLFDTKCQTVGGSGKHFDWSVLDDYQGETPFLLSGGIGPDDAARVLQFHHPRCVGIDLNSRFETAPAHKDITLLKAFLEQLNDLDAPGYQNLKKS